MEENNSIIKRKITKIFKQYKIILISNLNSIDISIQNNSNIYISNYNSGYLQKLFIENNTNEEIIEIISTLIEHNRIEIIENKINLKLILKPTFINNLNIVLILNKKKQLKILKSIDAHIKCVNSISIFPSGEIISVSNDKSINIYDINFNIIQHIENAHDNGINCVDIIDENNFITCSDDKNIKIWSKIKNEFKINKIINDAHNDCITYVIYFSNKKIISCSFDKTVKIWEEKEKNYQLMTTLRHTYFIWSLLYLKDKNILISSGWDGTKIWNINNFELIKYIKEVECYSWNAMCRIDKDKIIIGQGQLLKIISLFEKKIIKEIQLTFDSIGIILIKEKGIFLIGGRSNDILMYNNYNYECIQTYENVHDKEICGFIQLKNDLIASYSFDGKIKIWSF